MSVPSDPGYFCLFTFIRIPVMILRVLLLEHLISVALFTGEAEDICASFSNISFFSPEKLQGKFCWNMSMQIGKILV